MKRGKYQVPGSDTPISPEDMISEVKGFNRLQLYTTWQKEVICYSGYVMDGFKIVDDSLIGKIRVLTFSIN